ncbi:MAG: ABC transporter permease [Bacteroidaceae bacterium]|nr:ABC transporter permease [Bacteroidaceae bacterium]
MLSHNITIAWRNICKYGSQNIISVLGLSASLVCFSVCMHFVRFYTEAENTLENRDRLVKITGESSWSWYLNKNDAAKLKSLHLNTLSDVCTVGWPHTRSYLENHTGKELAHGLIAMDTDSSFVTLYAPHIVAGSWEQVAKNPNSIVLMASTARRIFGSEVEAIGQTLHRSETVHREHTYTVRAVMEDWNQQKSYAVGGNERNLDLLCVNDLVNEANHYYTRGLLAEGCSIEDLNEELLTVMTHFPFIGGIERGDLVLKASRIGDKGSMEIIIWSAVIGIALIILSVGLFNFLHLLIGSLLNRSHEYSMRRMMGCRWRDLFLMLMTQMTMLMIPVGWLCNYVLRWLDVRAIVSKDMVPPDVDRMKLLLEATEYTGWIYILCTIICLVLSLRIHRITIQRGIAGNTAAPRHQRKVSRNFILGFQFFTCWIFFSLTIALYLQSEKNQNESFKSLTREEKSQILSVSLNPDFVSIPIQEKSLLCQQLATHSGVKEIMPHFSHLFNYDGDHMFLSDAPDKEKSCCCPSMEYVPMNFFEFMNVKLISGRYPQRGGEVAADVYFAELFDENIIGKTFYSHENSSSYTVTGIVDRVVSRNDSRGTNPERLYMVDEHQEQISHVYLKCYPGQVEAVRSHVMAEYRKVFPENIEPKITTLMKDIEDSHSSVTDIQKMVRFLTIISLVITLLGIYSAITIDTDRRRREVAIRKVFGARFSDILWMFGRRYFWILVISAALAFPVGYLVIHFISTNHLEFIYFGFFFWLGIFVAIALLVVLTVLWRILNVAHTHPADEIAKS